MDLKRVAKVVSAGLVVAAVAQELRKPESERTWHGRIGGLVPYDFRPPTLERFRQAWWNPDDPRIFTDRAFGVGWAVNLGRVARLGQEVAR
jgi:hypothetical protein